MQLIMVGHFEAFRSVLFHILDVSSITPTEYTTLYLLLIYAKSLVRVSVYLTQSGGESYMILTQKQLCR